MLMRKSRYRFLRILPNGEAEQITVRLPIVSVVEFK
jgi:hypothetical protein